MNQSARFAVLMCGLVLSGCQAAGVLAYKAFPQTEKPKYVGLENQTIGVMVWADRAVVIDWDNIQLDTANAIQAAMQASKAKELRGAAYPIKPASIVRYQLDHPHLASVPVTDFAPTFGVSRLIYIELERFTTRSDYSYSMYRGTAVATLKVIEINDGQARIAYEENGIRAGFPRKGREEGEVVGTDTAFYVGTIRALAEQIVNRLTTHEVN